ncbi:bifunctional adenosylcobinamide kinase/adenosylcobinamide-phosphate guanylyltransferase [Plebeiibacterium sediminum]|uniref:Adenosylcobinamide kinase n=1 Tax=Plebeiibacterium sediminum TaxID=2992112 RepID=A0AAE3M2J7_9BACT|nr:bifunctional adenosylcobinamide kinase/adenosylcobinamide-phosphate guanylyltransferase [Plebeiobacterium sediminum]MCW3785604.1 bifunctional adenosylcobinamide kinase/adenosylcobinamide-phosphate guanylyltransferase [Plebeiobacterium sediminum]
MTKITFITGGQRSGKSSFAQDMALENSSKPVYLATSRIWDEEHKKRIERHKADRDERWENIEEEKFISQHNFSNKVVLMDCVTLWLTNFYFDNNSDIEKSLIEAKNEFEALIKQDAHYIIVTNEIGLGGMPENEIQRKFTDLQGWMNQHIASLADEVYFMVSGIPMKVK